MPHIAKTAGIAENLPKKSLLAAKSKQVMDEPVGSRMVHGKLLVKNDQGSRLSHTQTVPIEKAVDNKTPVEATRFALPYMFAKT